MPSYIKFSRARSKPYDQRRSRASPSAIVNRRFDGLKPLTKLKEIFTFNRDLLRMFACNVAANCATAKAYRYRNKASPDRREPEAPEVRSKIEISRAQRRKGTKVRRPDFELDDWRGKSLPLGSRSLGLRMLRRLSTIEVPRARNSGVRNFHPPSWFRVLRGEILFGLEANRLRVIISSDTVPLRYGEH